MIFHNLKIAVRNLVNNSSHTIINTVGLSIGITSALIIFSILSFNLSFDNFYDRGDAIFRLVTNEIKSGKSEPNPGMPYPLRLSLKQDFAEIEDFVMIDQNSGSIITITAGTEKLKYDEKNTYLACVTPSFFNVFERKFIFGNSNSLDEPNTVVISKRLAEKYFGNPQSAIGQTINYENLIDLTVTGIIENSPLNTDIPHEFLISFETAAEQRIWDSWTATSTSVQSFVKLKPNVDIEKFQLKIKDYIQQKKEEGDLTKVELLLQPLSEMHFNQDYPTLSGRVSTKESLWSLAIIGLLLIITSSINFINLNTAIAVRRSREIGIKKILGSSKLLLIKQFLLETSLVTGIALLLSIGAFELAQLHSRNFLGYEVANLQIGFNFSLFIFSLFACITLLSGLYPAFVIAKYDPIAALKNKIGSPGNEKFSTRKVLITFQLLVAQVLIISVIVVHQQIDKFMNEPTGFNVESIVEFPVPRPDQVDLNSFRTHLQDISGIENVSFSNTGTASDDSWGATMRYEINGEMLAGDIQVKIADKNYLDLYNLTLLSGTNIKEDTVRLLLLNEKALEMMSINDPNDILGSKLKLWGTEGEVVGIVQDFKTMSHHYEQEPVALWYQPDYLLTGAVKLNTSNAQQVISEMREEWQNRFPDFIFSYQFLDEKLAQFYDREQKMAEAFALFSIIAIVIGVVGLLGLVSYMINTRLKEIGIRKVLGAKVLSIIILIIKDIVLMSFVAFLFAAPVAAYFLNSWLESFAIHITLGVGIFVASLILSLFFPLLTVGYKTTIAALQNPVKILKDE